MKSNKGFSLVELIISMAVLAIIMAEVSSVLFSSTKVYTKGNSEIALQTEAQQTIMQLEDMMIDATESIESVYNVTVSSDSIITIKTKETYGSDVVTTYDITFEKADPADLYGNLYLSVDGVGHILMAEYVEYVILDTTGVDSGDENVIKISIGMRNDDYTYATEQNVFLRNMLGTGTGKRGRKTQASSANKYEVMRWQTFDMYSACISDIEEWEVKNGVSRDDYNFSFVWDATAANTVPTSMKADLYYQISGYNITTKDPINNQTNWNKEYGIDYKYAINCVATPASGGSPEVVCTFDVYTGCVIVGQGDPDISHTTYVNWANMDFINNKSEYGFAFVFLNTKNSTPLFTPVKLRGISMEGVQNLKIEYSFINYEGGSFVDLGSNEGGYAELTGSTGITCHPPEYNRGDTYGYFRIDNGWLKYVPSGNYLEFSFQRAMPEGDPHVLLQYANDGKLLDFYITATFDNGAQLQFDVFGVPVSPNDNDFDNYFQRYRDYMERNR